MVRDPELERERYTAYIARDLLDHYPELAGLLQTRTVYRERDIERESDPDGDPGIPE
ncbi:hypothetical protein [Nitrospira sp. Nam74]